MGPLEKEIRAIVTGGFVFPQPRTTWPTVWLICGAAESLGLGNEFVASQAYDADVFSEAIEAAEALGL